MSLITLFYYFENNTAGSLLNFQFPCAEFLFLNVWFGFKNKLFKFEIEKLNSIKVTNKLLIFEENAKRLTMMSNQSLHFTSIFKSLEEKVIFHLFP